MVNRKATALKLAALPIAALLTYTLSSKPAASLMIEVIAQTPSFSVPDSVPKGTNVQVSSSSDNMNSITEALKGGFENQYSNARVSVDTKDANAALQDVRSGNADLAAISRPLTAEEEAQGLVADPVRREKIAIIVGENNPFSASITGSQFAQIFRGEITNWNEVGGPDKPIRVIDRPTASETRQSLQPYPVFVSQPFETGGNATQVSEDSIDAIADELGDDGISYALVGQLEDASNVKAIKLHQTLPDDPRYPFSQPYSFVYAGGASPAVQAFLGYATNAPGQEALNSANLTGYGVAPTAGTTTADGGANNAAGTDGNAGENADGTTAEGTTGAALDPATGNTVNPDGTVTDADGNVVTTVEETETTTGGDIDGVAADGETGDLAGRGRWWWLLLPLAGLGLLIWAASKRGAEEETGYVASSADRDDGIRTNYRGTAGTAGDDGGQYATSGVGSKTSTGINRAVAGGTALAGGAAAAGAGLAGGAASRAKGAAGDAKMGLDGIKDGVQGNVQGGIDSVKSSTQGVSQGGLGNLRSNIQGGVDSARDRTQSGIDSAKGNFQGGIDGIKSRAQDGIDGVRGRAQGGIDGVRGSAQGGIDGTRANIQSRTDGIRDNVQGRVEGVRDNVQGRVDSTRTNLQGGVDNVKGSATEGSGNWLDRAKQRINEATDQVKDTASDIKDDVTGNDSNR